MATVTGITASGRAAYKTKILDPTDRTQFTGHICSWTRDQNHSLVWTVSSDETTVTVEDSVFASGSTKNVFKVCDLNYYFCYQLLTHYFNSRCI